MLWSARVRRGSSLSGAALLWGTLGLTPQVSAQQQEEVIVTAERREQLASDEGSSIAVLNDSELRRIGAHHPTEVLNRLPGVSYHRGSGIENLPAVRSPVLNGGAGAGSFLVMEDGVPLRAAPFANINQAYEANLEFADRVEVIRGPGTVVHGANAVHGVINVITPAADERTFRFEAEAGSFGRARSAVVSSAGGWLGGFAAVHEDGWRDNAGLDLQKTLIGWDGRASGWDLRLRASASNLEQETAGFVIGPRAYDSGALARGNLNPEAFRNSQVIRAALTGSGRAGGVDVTVTPFARHIETDLLLHFFPSKALEQTAQSGGGLQTTFRWSFHRWGLLAGVDLDRSTFSLTETQSIPTVGTFPQGVHYDYEVDAFARAAFTQATWRPDDNWSVALGLRGERVETEYDNRAPDGPFGRFLRANDRSDEFTALMGRTNAVRRLAGGGVAYVNRAVGARAPQATDLYSLQIAQAPGEQAVEEIVSTEAGLRLPVGAGHVGLVVYDMRKRHGSFRNANGFTVTDTRTNHRGVEIDFDLSVRSTLRLSGWIAYADHTYAFDSPMNGIERGARIESAPEWTAALHTLWRPTDRVELELEWNHMGAYRTDTSGDRTYPGHDVFSLRGAWRINGEMELFGAVRNATNTDYAERADFAFGNDRYFPGEDRSFSLGVRVVR